MDDARTYQGPHWRCRACGEPAYGWTDPREPDLTCPTCHQPTLRPAPPVSAPLLTLLWPPEEPFAAAS